MVRNSLTRTVVASSSRRRCCSSSRRSCAVGPESWRRLPRRRPPPPALHGGHRLLEHLVHRLLVDAAPLLPVLLLAARALAGGGGGGLAVAAPLGRRGGRSAAADGGRRELLARRTRRGLRRSAGGGAALLPASGALVAAPSTRMAGASGTPADRAGRQDAPARLVATRRPGRRGSTSGLRGRLARGRDRRGLRRGFRRRRLGSLHDHPGPLRLLRARRDQVGGALLGLGRGLRRHRLGGVGGGSVGGVGLRDRPVRLRGSFGLVARGKRLLLVPLHAAAAAAAGPGVGVLDRGPIDRLLGRAVALAALALQHRAKPRDVLLGELRHVAAHGDVHLPQEVHQGLGGYVELLGHFVHSHPSTSSLLNPQEMLHGSP